MTERCITMSDIQKAIKEGRVSETPKHRLELLIYYFLQLREVFGGTAYVVCPVSRILYLNN